MRIESSSFDSVAKPTGSSWRRSDRRPNRCRGWVSLKEASAKEETSIEPGRQRHRARRRRDPRFSPVRVGQREGWRVRTTAATVVRSSPTTSGRSSCITRSPATATRPRRSTTSCEGSIARMPSSTAGATSHTTSSSIASERSGKQEAAVPTCRSSAVTPKGFNTWTAGVAVLGNHHTAGAPSGAAVAAVESLAAWKLSLHGVDPLGVNWLQNRSSSPPHRFPERAWVEMPAIVGHRDLGLTACPGNLLYPSIPGMRQSAVPDHLSRGTSRTDRPEPGRVRARIAHGRGNGGVAVCGRSVVSGRHSASRPACGCRCRRPEQQGSVA